MGGKAHWTPRDYSALAREGYQRNAIVYRCIRMISEAAASAPLCVRRGDICEPGDPAARLLDAPHPDLSAPELFEQFYGHLQVSGNAYLQAGFVDEVPAALFALRPDRVRVMTDKAGRPAGWEYDAGGLKKTYRRDPLSGRAAVHHMRLFHPTDDVYGFSPLEAAAQAVDVHNEGGVWTKSLLDNSARPSGALVYKGASGQDRLSETAGVLVWGGAAAARLEALERRAERSQLISERMARLEEQMLMARESLTRIERQLENPPAHP